MRKRVMAVLLVGCMAVGMTACGSSKDTAKDETWECVVTWPSTGDTPEGFQAVEDAINEITVPKINVSVKLEPIYCYDLDSEQMLAVSSGDKLDLILELFNGNTSYVNSDALLPLDDLYEEYGDAIADVYGDSIEAGKVNGTLYSIPCTSSGQSYGYIVRSDILEKYGYSTENRDVSMDEIEEIFAKVKAGEGDNFYMIAGSNAFDNYMALDNLGQSGYSGGILCLDSSDPLKIQNAYKTDEYKKYAETCYEWAQKGYISGDAVSNSQSNAENVATGKYFGFASSTGAGQDQWASNAAGYKMTCLTTRKAICSTSDCQTVMWSIASNCENPEKAMQLLNLMYEENDIGMLLSYGIEGEDYVVKEKGDDGNMIISYPEGEDSTTIPYYNMFGVWRGGQIAQFEPYTLDYFKEVDEAYKNINYSPAYGYVFDTTNVATQLSAVNAVVTQYAETINAGVADPETTLGSLWKDLDSAGYQEVIDENQKQLDQYMDKQDK